MQVMIKSKICLKCLIDKPLSEYYENKTMKDGLLNKCKPCVRERVNIREKELQKNPEWVEKEKARSREKAIRLGYKDKYKQEKETLLKYAHKHRIAYPEKYKASCSISKTKAIVKGNHLHHWSYNKEHYRDVIELTLKEHYGLHRYIVYDQERMMYRRYDTNELLDTKENHIAFFESIKYKI